jgi:hypothetical protein
MHWPNAANSSVLFDLTGGVPRPRTRDHRAYAERATAALHSLLSMPDMELRRLRRGVAAAAPGLLYGLESAPLPMTLPSASDPHAGEPNPTADAVDVVVEQMRRVRRMPDAGEQASYQLQLERRQALIAKQRQYELQRRAARWVKPGAEKPRTKARRRPPAT